jgi:threonine dehydrogenase-like Zn-dependent dehydrogenase
MAGACPVLVTGMGRDARRLGIARALGADVAVNVEDQDLTEVVRQATGGAMASVVVDTAAGDAVTTSAAFRVLRQGGTLVLAARQKQPIQFEINQVRDKALAVRGVRGHSYQAVEWALGLLASGWEGTEALGGAVFALKEIDDALAAAGNGEVVHACVDPWR